MWKLAKLWFFLLCWLTGKKKGLTFVWRVQDNLMDNNTDDLSDSCGQISEQSLTLELRQRTLVGLLYKPSCALTLSLCLLCCQLSCWLYLHALCIWEIWDVAQLSMCGPVVSSSSWLPGSPCHGLHVNMLIKIGEVMSHSFFDLSQSVKDCASSVELLLFVLHLSIICDFM